MLRFQALCTKKPCGFLARMPVDKAVEALASQSNVSAKSVGQSDRQMRSVTVRIFHNSRIQITRPVPYNMKA
jgi:hypothetical protein